MVVGLHGQNTVLAVLVAVGVFNIVQEVAPTPTTQMGALVALEIHGGLVLAIPTAAQVSFFHF